jgi:hypothetical protein
MNKNSINWFEIPAVNFNRAKKFYENILGSQIKVMGKGKSKLGILPNFDMNGGVGGHISTNSRPSENGTMVYINGGDDLNIILSKIEKAGGKVIMTKTKSPGGFMATFVDSEGNKLALHSAK